MNQPALRLATHAMGTRFELALLDGHGDLRAAGEAAIDEISSWHRRLSRFADDSLVSHINREASRMPVRLDRDTFELLQDAIDVWQRSEGAFDITIAPAATGSRDSNPADSSHDCPRGPRGIQLDRERWTVAFSRPHVSIDLGGIGKGHALDCAARVLRDAGITAALLHGGTSSIVAIGAPHEVEGWRVAIGPGADTRMITLRDAAMSVSDPWGPAEKRRGHPHILDPRSGGTVSSGVRATVTGPSARLADAWSTALVVLGRVPAMFPSGFSAFVDLREEALLP